MLPSGMSVTVLSQLGSRSDAFARVEKVGGQHVTWPRAPSLITDAWSARSCKLHAQELFSNVQAVR